MNSRPYSFVAVMGVLSIGCGGHDYIVNTQGGRMVVSPGMVDMDTVAVGSETSVELQLIAAEGIVDVLAMHIQNVEGEWFELETIDLPTVTETEDALVTLSYAPLDEGFHWATLSIVTDEDEGFEHLVDIRGVADWASAQATPTIVDFGPVYVGEQGSETITFTNTSGLDLELQGITGGDAPFTVDAELPIQVLGGLSVDLDITFEPGDLDEATTELGFVTDAALEIDPVVLRGNACSTAAGSLYDQDGDGFGWCANDCDDRDANAHPGNAEEIDGVDNDCDGLIDEGTTAYDDDGDGYTESAGDCDDDDPLINPGAMEIANWIDDDCDGTVDDGTQYADDDGDGFTELGGDCDDSDATINPGSYDVAGDGVDADCDGEDG